MIRVGGLAALLWLAATGMAGASPVTSMINNIEAVELRLNRIASDPVMDSEKPFTAWIGGNGTKVHSNEPGLRSDLQQVTAGGGLDYRLFDTLTVGIGVLHEDTYVDLIDAFGFFDRVGWMVAPYVAWSPLSHVTVWGSVGWTDLDNTAATGAGGRGRFDGERRHAMAGASINYPIGGWRLGVSARYLWVDERDESYTTTNGTFINGDERNIEQGRATVSVGYDFGGFKPFFLGGAEREFKRPRTVFVGTRAISPDDEGYLIGGGIDFQLAPFRGTLRYVEELGRDTKRRGGGAAARAITGDNAKRLELSLELPF